MWYFHGSFESRNIVPKNANSCFKSLNLIIYYNSNSNTYINIIGEAIKKWNLNLI